MEKFRQNARRKFCVEKTESTAAGLHCMSCGGIFKAGFWPYSSFMQAAKQGRIFAAIGEGKRY